MEIIKVILASVLSVAALFIITKNVEHRQVLLVFSTLFSRDE